MPLDPHEQEMLKDAALKLNRAMEIRFEMHLRVARRVTKVIRVGMTSLAVAAVAMSLLVFSLTYHMMDMIEAIDTMNHHFTNISNDMVAMREAITRMDHSVAAMPTIVEEVELMDGTVQQMRGNVLVLSQRLHNINGNMDAITGNIVRMTNGFGAMNQTVFNMGVDINRMSGPMKMFNRMMPIK